MATAVRAAGRKWPPLFAGVCENDDRCSRGPAKMATAVRGDLGENDLCCSPESTKKSEKSA
jgi:hypothetical protein